MAEERQKISLNDGIPKMEPKRIVEELRATLYDIDGNFQRFFPDDKEKKYRANFELFDRDNDGMINLSELRELLTSIGQMFPEEELEELYNELKETERDTFEEGAEIEGVKPEHLFILVSKKYRDEDKNEQLLEAYKMTDRDNSKLVDAEYFKELLQMMGERWTEDQADAFMKELKIDKEDKFDYEAVVKKFVKALDSIK